MDGTSSATWVLPGRDGISGFLAALAARIPAPGGGAAAAMTAATACSLGAMTARYTTGKRFAEISDQSSVLADSLVQAAHDFLDLAEADARAYGAVAAAAPGPEREAAMAQSMAVPAEILSRCAAEAERLRAFRSRCNPRLLGDLSVAMELLISAGHGAMIILGENNPGDELRRHADARLKSLDALRSGRGVSGDGERPG